MSSSQTHNEKQAGANAHYSHLHNTLVKAVRKVCPVWLAEDVDDLVQEAMVRILKLEKQQQRDLNNSYLYRTAHSVVVDEIRRRKKRAQDISADDNGESIVESMPDTKTQPAQNQAIGDGITDCLQQQKPERRQALTLYLLGHSIKEAGELLGWPAKRTENLIYRGLVHLRACLQAKGLNHD